MLWRCWLGVWNDTRPVKTEWRGAGVVMAQLMPLPLTVSCFSKIKIGFTFLVPAHPGSSGQRAVKRVWLPDTADILMYCHMQVTYKDYNTCVLNNKCVQLALLLRLCCDHIVILILICLQFFCRWSYSKKFSSERQCFGKCFSVLVCSILKLVF